MCLLLIVRVFLHRLLELSPILNIGEEQGCASIHYTERTSTKVATNDSGLINGLEGE
jgi:hypothetical protein